MKNNDSDLLITFEEALLYRLIHAHITVFVVYMAELVANAA